MNQPDVRAGTLHLGDDRPDRGFVRGAVGEEAAQARFGRKQARGLRSRLVEHRAHQRFRLRHLIRCEGQALAQLEDVLHVEGAGASLGEVPVFDGGGYVATAVALTDARLLFVEREALFALCRRRPDVALGIIAVLAQRLRRFAALIEDLALRDVTERLAGFLLAEAPRAGGFFEIGTQDEVASRLGTVRELVSRSLASPPPVSSQKPAAAFVSSTPKASAPSPISHPVPLASRGQGMGHIG